MTFVLIVFIIWGGSKPPTLIRQEFATSELCAVAQQQFSELDLLTRLDSQTLIGCFQIAIGKGEQ